MQYVHTTANATVTTTFTTNTISVVTTCKVKSIDMKIPRSMLRHRLSERHQQCHGNG